MAIEQSSTRSLAKNVMRLVSERGLRIATAESCTGGQLSAMLTDIEGYSHCVECAFVTYSDQSKTSLLGIPNDIIAEYGAVSEETVRLMASGALRRSKADMTLAITGYAGVGAIDEPSGLVHLALADASGVRRQLRRQYDETGRDSVRRAEIDDALHMILAHLLTDGGTSNMQTEHSAS